MFFTLVWSEKYTANIFHNYLNYDEAQRVKAAQDVINDQKAISVITVSTFIPHDCMYRWEQNDIFGFYRMYL